MIKNEYNLDPNNLSKEEKWAIKEFEEELLRKNNMKLVFPNNDYNDYKI